MLKEIKLKDNQTGKTCYVSDLPQIEDIPQDILDAFIRSYEQTIFNMFAHKRSKKIQKQKSDK